MNRPVLTSLDLVREVLGQYCDAPPHSVVPEAELAALKVDSLTLAELLFELEDRIGVTIAESTTLPTRIADVLALVEPHMDLIRAKAAA